MSVKKKYINRLAVQIQEPLLQGSQIRQRTHVEFYSRLILIFLFPDPISKIIYRSNAYFLKNIDIIACQVDRITDKLMWGLLKLI